MLVHSQMPVTLPANPTKKKTASLIFVVPDLGDGLRTMATVPMTVETVAISKTMRLRMPEPSTGLDRSKRSIEL